MQRPDTAELDGAWCAMHMLAIKVHTHTHIHTYTCTHTHTHTHTYRHTLRMGTLALETFQSAASRWTSNVMIRSTCMGGRSRPPAFTKPRLPHLWHASKRSWIRWGWLVTSGIRPALPLLVLTFRGWTCSLAQHKRGVGGETVICFFNITYWPSVKNAASHAIVNPYLNLFVRKTKGATFKRGAAL